MKKRQITMQNNQCRHAHVFHVLVKWQFLKKYLDEKRCFIEHHHMERRAQKKENKNSKQLLFSQYM